MKLGRPRGIGAVAVATAMAVIGFVPLFAGPGYELALAAGLCCPVAAAAVTAVEVMSPSRRARRPLWAFFRGLENGILLALSAYLVGGLLHGLRAGFCDFGGGSLLFLLGPAAGTVLGGVWGAAAAGIALSVCPAEWRRRTVLAAALAGAGPALSVLVQLALFYTTPMIFAYDPFAGYFSGALYDTVVDFSGLYSYRAATVATLLVAGVGFYHLRADEDRGGWRLCRPRQPRLALAGGVAALVSLLSVLSGHELGHWQTTATIEAQLGGRIDRGCCHVRHAATLSAGEAALFARDCDSQVRSLRQWLGSPATGPVTVLLFADSEQKRALMGASRTSVAKPWRREIYVQHDSYPHGALRHELAHVILGEVAGGPFKIAGPIGGWLPSPGLIEGAAVAAAPPDGDLSLAEWAAAMRRIGVLPPVQQLLGLSFFARASAAGYTAAGSFVEHVRSRYGATAIRAWYGGEPLPDVTGRSWQQLEQAWWQQLDELDLDRAALAQARTRFDRPSVFGRRCPHRVDAALQQADQLASSQDHGRALSAYRRALQLDPQNSRALLGAASCYDRGGDSRGADQALAALDQDELLSAADRSRALEQRGDLALRRGDGTRADGLYEQARAEVVSDDRLRALDIKQAVSRAGGSATARAAVVALLIGASAERGPSTPAALDLLGRWRAEAPGDGLPDYLLGRQHFNSGDYQLAAERLDEALGKRIRLPRVVNEALWLRLRCGCALGDGEAARLVLARYDRQAGVAHNRLRYARELVQRCVAYE